MTDVQVINCDKESLSFIYDRPIAETYPVGAKLYSALSIASRKLNPRTEDLSNDSKLTDQEYELVQPIYMRNRTFGKGNKKQKIGVFGYAKAYVVESKKSYVYTNHRVFSINIEQARLQESDQMRFGKASAFFCDLVPINVEGFRNDEIYRETFYRINEYVSGYKYKNRDESTEDLKGKEQEIAEGFKKVWKQLEEIIISNPIRGKATHVSLSTLSRQPAKNLSLQGRHESYSIHGISAAYFH